ncbi:FeoB-associated Cys-rich membrane protein, partial [Ralstonia pseudosolanacearum]|uniref:FeoB-associated Cys-rich membrane protein n=1 Tax=Ralstonia pseudosolanacearum TaxID=1310165 RepID=UPI003CEAE5B2
MNFGTFIVIVILAAIVIADIRYLMKHGVDSCKGDCSSCHGSCKFSEDLKRAKK